MFTPTLFNRASDDFDRNFFSDFFAPSVSLMRTDIEEKKDGYRLSVELPGFSKDNISVELKDGYLNIKASGEKKDEKKDKDGKLIRSERYTGNCARSFYVGDSVTEDDIKAHFENGILNIDIPKKEKNPEIEAGKRIAIEG